MIDAGRRLPPLLSARVGGGGARERRNCELCGQDMGHVYMLAAMLIKRIPYIRGQWAVPALCRVC